MLSFLLCFWLATAACSARLPSSSKTPVTTEDENSAWYTVYFTDPNSPTADTYRSGPDAPLANAIREARLRVDIAAYNLNLWSIRDALIAVHERGVEVRMVVESDNLDEPEIQAIKDAGVSIIGDRREGLMHNKFIVIDGLEVWSGSMNYTTSDAYRNNNNLIRLRSAKLAEDYTKEFEEMFVDDLFGPDTRAETPNPRVTVDGVQVEVYFSPDDGVSRHLVELLKGARKSIFFLAYSFTSDDLARAILERSRAGVSVSGVFDESQVKSNIGGEWDSFRKAGLDIRLDGNPSIMHHKVMIIDGEILVTGSYNFSANAEERNDENLLVLHDARLASEYMVEFERVYEEGHR
jgi:phosphatidylserine/phosphatidylglycerophosphate/cardiolipin synthase-like enzyme